ncbi:hypothetical protein ANCDUO_17969 [Ancylostoma duodenale]|uniref:Uncharacterized protein n=1 Tax=Ancylostoma duodenale TaxID=51022 RepID=A0A0C2G4F9_9BILA|nr:hypothetical protein ANCDUO_17969 [Ancylostoma duodenale]
MRVEQVQNERDVIGKRVRTASTCTTQTKPYTIKRHQSADEWKSLVLKERVRSLANSVCEDILVTKLSGVARLDVLMEELMLADAEEQNKCSEREMIPVDTTLSTASDFGSLSNSEKT